MPKSIQGSAGKAHLILATAKDAVVKAKVGEPQEKPDNEKVFLSFP
jgi:hypothetical protein